MKTGKQFVVASGAISLLMAAAGTSHAFTQGRLMSGEAIGFNQVVYTGTYNGGALVMQTDQNLVLYINGNTKAVWSPQTQNSSGIIARMEENGDFTVRDGWTSLKWHTNTGNYPGAHLEVRQDKWWNGAYTADVVIVATSGAVVWRASDQDPGHFYGGNINACTGAFCPSTATTSIVHRDGYGHDRNGYDLAGMPMHAYTELMCINDCLSKNSYSYGSPTCVAYTYDSSNGNCWLKGWQYSGTCWNVPPVIDSGSTVASGVLDPAGGCQVF